MKSGIDASGVNAQPESSLAEFTSSIPNQTMTMPSYKDQQKFRSVDPNNRPPRPVRQPATPAPPRMPKGVEEIRKTKEYKTAARRWLSTIVALPIVIVSSWVLYERFYGNKSPKRLTDKVQKD